MTVSTEQEIRTLRAVFWSDRDPEGRAFAPLADAYRRAGDFRQAVELLNDGLDRHPDFVAGHVVSARLYLEKGLVAEAEIASRRALGLDAENTSAMESLAGVLESKGEADAAGELRERLTALLPPDGVEVTTGRRGNELAQVLDDASAELVDLAPDAEPVMELADLAPDAEPVMELADLAPDEEPVMELADLAPDEEPVMELADLAPDAEPVMELADLAPDAEPVMELADLAPDAESVMELADLAPDEEPQPGAVEESGLVTRTMAELYVRQGLTGRALELYRQLLQAAPGDPDLQDRIDALTASSFVTDPSAEETDQVEVEEDDGVAESAWDAGAHVDEHEVDTPFAWTAQEAEESEHGPPVSDYFERLLGWGHASGDTEGSAPESDVPGDPLG